MHSGAEGKLGREKVLLACFLLCLQHSLLFSCGKISWIVLFVCLFLSKYIFPFSDLGSQEQPSPDGVASLRNVIAVMFVAFSLFTVMLSGINYCKGISVII